MSDAFVEALRREITEANRELWIENTAMLLAFGNGHFLPDQQDWATARERVGELGDDELMSASLAVAEADAKRCPECGRPYDDA